MAVPSISQEALSENIAKLVEMKAQYPSLPVFVSVPESGNNIQMVKLMDNPNPEMWELRRKAVLDIAAKFNFPAMLLNDMSDAGGLNVESEQYAMWGQKIEQVRHDFEHDVLAPLLDCFPVITDWELRIAREDDEDTLTELRIMQTQATIMQTLHSIGFDVQYRNREIVVSDTIVHDRTPTMDYMMKSDPNYGDEDAVRTPLFDISEEMDWVAQRYSKDFLRQNQELILNIAMAAEYVKEVITSILASDVEELYRILIEEMSNPKGWSIQDIITRLRSRFNLDYSKAMTIARTEARRVSTIAREQDAIANDPPDAVYKWQGANDHRTTRQCNEIKERVRQEGGAVPLGRLRQIVREVGMRHASPGFRMIDDWTPHINCRHDFQRVRL